MDNKIEEIKEAIDRILKTNKDICIMSHTDSDKNHKNHLRVYYHGGLIGYIPLKDSCEFNWASKDYVKYYNDKLSSSWNEMFEAAQGEKPDLEKKNYFIETYLPKILEAVDNRGFGERKVQTDIVANSRKLSKKLNWAIVDIEYNADTRSNKDELEETRKKGKVDFVVFDKKNKKLGLIELKFNNDHTDNLGKHFIDYQNISEKKADLNRKIKERIEEL